MECGWGRNEEKTPIFNTIGVLMLHFHGLYNLHTLLKEVKDVCHSHLVSWGAYICVVCKDSISAFKNRVETTDHENDDFMMRINITTHCIAAVVC